VAASSCGGGVGAAGSLVSGHRCKVPEAKGFYCFLEKPFRPHLNVRISYNLVFTAAPLFGRHMNWTAEM
jgi:hypothetical protein